MKETILAPGWAKTGPIGQHGVATLMVSVVLLLLLTIMSFTAARMAVQQQRLAGTDLHTREAHEAAEAGLEFALAWLRQNACNQGSCDPAVCNTDCFPGVGDISVGSGYSFSPRVSFTVQPGGFLLVQSTAVSNEDSDIRSVVQQVIRQTDLLTPSGRSAPPVVVDGCSSGNTGTTDIFPRPGAKAMISLDLKGQSLTDCLDVGHISFKLCDDNGTQVLCSADTGLQIDVTGPAYLGDESANRPNTIYAAWDYIFTEPLAEAKQKAADAGQVYTSDNDIPAGDAPEVPYIVYDSRLPFNRNANQGHIGSPTRPVIIIVPAARNCPTFNGSSKIYGFIYFENEDACRNEGWGGTDVYGSVIYEGDGNKFTGNANLFDVGNLDGGGEEDTTLILDDIAKALGSWKDWTP